MNIKCLLGFHKWFRLSQVSTRYVTLDIHACSKCLKRRVEDLGDDQ